MVSVVGRPAGISDGETDDDEFDDFYGSSAPVPRMPLNRQRNNNTAVPTKVSRADVDLDDFRIASMKGNLTVVRNYIERGVPANQVLRSGWTALMYAASCGRWQVVEYLLEHQANPNFHKELFTPLMAACASSHDDEDDLVKCIEILLAKGANLNATERHKVTPLMFACKERRQKIAKCLLLRPDIQINMQDNRGWTALMWAADKGEGAIVRMLLEHGDKGADRNLISQSGQNAADIALASGHKEVASLLDLSLLKPATQSATADVPPSPTSTTETIATVGELETILLGLDLNNLIPLFQKNGMNFDTFLLLDDEDLDRMGIEQVGYRTRLLNAVKEIHTKEWERGSLPAVQYSKHLSCPEATALMSNLALHGRYMLASVAYLRDQIQRRPRILQLGMQTASVHALAAQTQFAIKNVTELQSQLKFLKRYLDKIQDEDEFIPADLITDKRNKKKPDDGFARNWPRYAVMLAVVATSSLVLLSSPLLRRSSTVLLEV